ncbi:hypothetical protein MJD09_16245 [bacterium]|nr:hypothetical protein [bacterium]
MANLWDDIARTIRDGVDTVVEKTEELTKIGKIKVDVINIKRNIDKNFAELGGKVYHLVVEEKNPKVAGEKEVQDIIESVKILEKELEQKNTELKSIREKEGASGESRTQKKTSAKTATRTKAKTTNSRKPKTASTKTRQAAST